MGETEFTIPMAPHFTCEDYVSIGRIITHQFVQCGAFPVRISQASITQALVGDVSPETLISSFLKLLPPREREIIEKGLSDSTAFSQDEIMEILEDYHINTLPTTANLASLITQIGRNELAQKPYLHLLRIRRGMGPMWDGVSEEEIASIYNLCQPTMQRIIDEIYMVHKDPKDGQIMRWLQRYLKICSGEALVNFLLMLCDRNAALKYPPSSCLQQPFVLNLALVLVSSFCQEITHLLRSLGRTWTFTFVIQICGT
jgi:hypothetical protein